MSTFNKILIAALIAQIGLAVAIRAGGDATESVRQPEPLLRNFDINKVTRIAIFDERGQDKPKPADQKPDDQKDGQPEGQKNDKQNETPVIELVRNPQGNKDGQGSTWVLASHHGFPAQASTVDELLGKLSAMSSRGPTVTSAVRHKQLEVTDDKYRRKLVIDTGSGQTTVFIGASVGSRQVAVRLSGQDDVHQVSGISAIGIGTAVSGWIDTTYFNVLPQDVAYLSIRNKNNTYEFQRNESDRWTLVRDGQPYPLPPGTKFNSLATDNWLRDATRILASEPADPARTVDTPLATIRLRMKPKTNAPDGSAEGTAQAGDQGAGNAANGNDSNDGGNGAAGQAAAPGAPGAGQAPPAPGSEPAVSEAPDEYVIEVLAEENEMYHVRLQGNPHPVMAKKTGLKSLVELTDNLVIIPVERK